MDQHPTADQAFATLSAEVALLRQSVDAQTIELQSRPDYAPSLAAMEDQYQRIVHWANRVAETPLLRFTPEQLESEIARVAGDARKREREMAEQADARISKAIAGIERVTESAWSAAQQWRALCLTSAISVLITMGLTLALVTLDSNTRTQPPRTVIPTVKAGDPPPSVIVPPTSGHGRRRHRAQSGA